jgi:DNA-binding transcriptional ArsR family regulator
MRSYRALDAGLPWEPGHRSIPRRVWPRGRPLGACPIWDLLRIRRYIAGIWRHSSVWMVPPVALCGWFSRTLSRASFDSASRIEYTRREILARIWDRDLSAGEIAAAFTLTAATISEHLAVLRRAGLVEMTKVGPPVDIGPSPPRWPACTARSRMRANGVRQDDLPEQSLTMTTTALVVVAQVDLPTPPEATFAALTDGELYSRWAPGPGQHRRRPVRSNP